MVTEAKPIDFGKAIARRRGWQLMTQDELAAACNVNSSFISLIEGGKRSPSLETLVAIAKALEMPLWRLVHLAEVGE